ncbi:intradiol ring-cleavage dioxygenase [Pelagibacterium halotolerans]|uniref:Catechol 1,2-dioxygenase n=1 Tax=Pelagibacterium halotolerans (strain DSM 22347 / JCM 15775 / CGMCC 1.7692 / B2) TaxID=1082931 RepID=G4RGG7_PELHB|nr:intradiol ring-cleavage dioxygenase [Pelagibacterium halotolerans]AEQ50143.1 catechol 1,2-dioxygenase [Pelagibacterium halotolerans B2]QJR19844.1 intradiol ring-cleavage dioxygenase [Pelagibacterium halotolerans]SEA49008.1 hydroxyquinol 1,2-dioxygenase [Pelagibacterium halotolerans]
MSTRDFNEHSITDAVVERFSDTPDLRLRQIMQALVRHAHAFVREVELSQDEWLEAIGFLTRTGHITDDKRQEFILLSDTLGISMLVDAINHRMPEGTTETTVLGPFYVDNPPLKPADADISGGEHGTPLYVTATITAPDGTPLVGAHADVWQSDEDGFYDVQKPGDDPNLRARFITDQSGRISFWTIVPKFYPIPADGPVGAMLKATNRHPYRPAHIHFMIGNDGYETLVTHLFIEDDPYLDSDAVFGVKQSLVVTLEDGAGTPPAAANKPAGNGWKRLNHNFGLKPVR